MPVKLSQQSVPGATASDVQPPAPVVQPSLLPPTRPLIGGPPAPPGRVAVEYPYEDGIAMASSPEQMRGIVDTHHALDDYFASRPRVFLAMDLLVYDREGDNTSCLAPDVFVTFDVPGPVGKSYRIWLVGKPPDVVWEFGSDSTWKEDAKEKKERYRRWGVAEYWLYAPHGGMHDPRLQGFQLVKGRYRRLPAERRSDGLLVVKSPLLGLEQHFDGQRLRLWDPVVKEYLRTGREDARERRKERAGRLKERAGRVKERTGRVKERTGRLEAEAENVELRTENVELRTENAELRARIAELEVSGAIPRK